MTYISIGNFMRQLIIQFRKVFYTIDDNIILLKAKLSPLITLATFSFHNNLKSWDWPFKTSNIIN